MNSYRLRKNYVIVKVVKSGNVGRICVPDAAEEGKHYLIQGIGPDVTDLEVGDRVVLFADNDTTFFNIPGERDLVVIRENYVSAVVSVLNEETSNGYGS